IDRELAGRAAGMARDAVIADVRDRRRLSSVFGQARPELVFHAAALKHVPLVESNIFEGVATNVMGTVNVADAAKAAGAEVLVLISTDKAVNPTNVMGASKRIAESYCQALDLEHGDGPETRFVTVRFGNVLGSTGSVVELFRDQLAHGGPLSVTHPDMTRYFMTTHEAVELVLQASALGSGAKQGEGRIFVLDMGEPVRIMDLASQMIRLAGMEPGKDVQIEIVGPRPGEKLFEETLYGDETLLPTACKGILLAAPKANPLATVTAGIEALSDALAEDDQKRLMEIIRAMVPEYHPPKYDAPKSSAAE
ncbi:MAG: polysaccharide biosynthesis protein, partial [Rhodospirillales bacterium]|nr:polysaccharide biosynthesis protein [Rhodospirillales bacterium]